MGSVFVQDNKSPSNRLKHFTQNHKCQPSSGAKGRSEGYYLELLGFITWKPWTNINGNTSFSCWAQRPNRMRRGRSRSGHRHANSVTIPTISRITDHKKETKHRDIISTARRTLMPPTPSPSVYHKTEVNILSLFCFVLLPRLKIDNILNWLQRDSTLIKTYFHVTEYQPVWQDVQGELPPHATKEKKKKTAHEEKLWRHSLKSTGTHLFLN